MRRVSTYALSWLAGCFLVSMSLLAWGRNIGDYPLRVHIYQFNSHSHYYQRALETVDGEGRANLYQNGEPRGFDFSYRCGERLRTSAGFETYPARWKKQDQSLEVLLPVIGKQGAFDSCEMKVEMKDTAYFKHAGVLDEEPAAVFKQWMERHQYDPEHGRNEPVAPGPPSGVGGAVPADAPPPPATTGGSAPQ
jgi:hypothetical protein